MKNVNAMLLMGFLATTLTSAKAQTVTLTATNGQPSSYNVNTNQIVTVNSFISSPGSGAVFTSDDATMSLWDGRKIKINPYGYGLNLAYDSYQPATRTYAMAFAGGAVFTGVTNIFVSASQNVVALTVTITTPTPQSSVPVNTVVIPTDATGPVQIVLESSADLVNWTSALPGTYGNTHSNRFFRVRAVAQ